MGLGIPVYQGVDLLDVAGPLEMFWCWPLLSRKGPPSDPIGTIYFWAIPPTAVEMSFRGSVRLCKA